MKQESRKEQIERLRNEKDAIESLLRGLEDEEVAEALLASENASEADLELPVVGYTVTATGPEWTIPTGPVVYTALTEEAVKNWLGLATGIIEPVVRKSDAEKIIRELSDMVTSLSETQTGYDPSRHEETFDEVVKLVESMPILVAEKETHLAPVLKSTTTIDKVTNQCIRRVNEGGLVGVPMSHTVLLYPANLNKATMEAATAFIIAVMLKLRHAEIKYGYSDGWVFPGWMTECKTDLRKHLEKGDPRDVAAYAMFLWYHGESTKLCD